LGGGGRVARGTLDPAGVIRRVDHVRRSDAGVREDLGGCRPCEN
jgi:hypothetical protein